MCDASRPDDLEPDDENVDYPDASEGEPTDVPGEIGWLPDDDEDGDDA